jgi:hypothetical protein
MFALGLLGPNSLEELVTLVTVSVDGLGSLALLCPNPTSELVVFAAGPVAVLVIFTPLCPDSLCGPTILGATEGLVIPTLLCTDPRDGLETC